VSWPLKARRPVLNLGPFYDGLFRLLRPRGVRAPVPWRLVRTPRVSRHFAASRKRNRSRPGRLACRQGVHRKAVRVWWSVNEGAVERGTMTTVCKSTTQTVTLFPTPLDDGTITRGQGEERTQCIVHTRLPKIDICLRPTRHCS
jgi:hypothetical protein